VNDLEEARRAGKPIYDESQRMARLVGDLLTLARFDAGVQVAPETSLDLTNVLPIWVARFQSRAREAGISLSLSVDSPPPVEGDAERLEQAMANVVDNAIKYNHEGGRVDVTAWRGSASHASPRGQPRKGSESIREWAVIRVSDTGPGIRKSHLPRMLERFYRGDRARHAGGSGLGLSIAEEIVKAHHGWINVQSEEGKGTSFSLWLPAKA
jgi:signal transduction histidine kinase